MFKPKVSNVERLNAAEKVIDNSLSNPEILSLVAGYGYSEARLREGRALLRDAKKAFEAQIAAEGAQKTATQEQAASRKIAYDAYQALAKVSRGVFRQDPPRIDALGLRGGVPARTGGFIALARALFNNAEAAPGLAEYGYDAARLASERAKIEAFAEAEKNQEIAKGKAQLATRAQQSAMAALDAWRLLYVRIAKVALRGKPDLLEQAGVLARNTKTAAQRAARRKKVTV